MFSDLRAHESRRYSESGEDGALEYLFDRLGHGGRYYVEFGACDGFDRSNTANLREHHGWTGLLMDGDPRGSDLVRREFVTAENIEALLVRYGVPRHFDLLSIDIDGNDYWVWDAIQSFRPRVVLIEYNVFFPLDTAVTVPYDPVRRWDTSTFHGASLAALRKLGRAKGYSLVHTDSWAPNAFFVESSRLALEDRDRPISDVASWVFDTTPRHLIDLSRQWVHV